MEYNLLICTATTKWIAIDINPNGELERLSLDGNDFAEVHSTEDVLEFCAKILGYYNINNFNDINLNIKIVMVSKYSPLNLELFMQLKDAASVNLIDAKTVMPIYVLKNCLVKANTKIGILCMEERFSFIVDDNLTVSYENAEEGEDLRIEPENFSIVFRFNCKNLISVEREFKELEKKQDEIKSLQEEQIGLNNDFVELDKHNNRENARIREFKKNIESRINIIRLNTNKSWNPFCFRDLSDYKVQLLKSEGDIIERGTDIISFYMDSGQPYDRSTIATTSRGKIHYLVKDGDIIRSHDAVAILYDPLDKKKDVIRWYKNHNL
ncbi:hypothetical protein [Oribacterium sinus]|uniref:Uncharacterized protein n=2 Tax=Oribacterium sinus TaxID=237576 RepID=C2KZ40_9FIRM|nr:hypothetical protein [Oribacterium sinus]EEJ50970.1 hypothetical protein HMPREF6123_1759 [Oribacterium sinus F0268]